MVFKSLLSLILMVFISGCVELDKTSVVERYNVDNVDKTSDVSYKDRIKYYTNNKTDHYQLIHTLLDSEEKCLWFHKSSDKSEVDLGENTYCDTLIRVYGRDKLLSYINNPDSYRMITPLFESGENYRIIKSLFDSNEKCLWYLRSRDKYQIWSGESEYCDTILRVYDFPGIECDSMKTDLIKRGVIKG